MRVQGQNETGEVVCALSSKWFIGISETGSQAETQEIWIVRGKEEEERGEGEAGEDAD